MMSSLYSIFTRLRQPRKETFGPSPSSLEYGCSSPQLGFLDVLVHTTIESVVDAPSPFARVPPSPPPPSPEPESTSVPTTTTPDAIQTSSDSQTPTPPTTPTVATSVLITPPPAAYQPPIRTQDDLIHEFFGGRSDSRISLPPPYARECHLSGELPAYPSHSTAFEPTTLARVLFMYGFIFPPIWFASFIIFVRPTPERTEKNDCETGCALPDVRSVELKWARRSLLAAIIWIACIGIVVATVVLTGHP